MENFGGEQGDIIPSAFVWWIGKVDGTKISARPSSHRYYTFPSIVTDFFDPPLLDPHNVIYGCPLKLFLPLHKMNTNWSLMT